MVAGDEDALGAEERSIVARVLSEARGRPVQIEGVTRVWDRPHVLGVAMRDGSTAFVKMRRRRRPDELDDRNFAAEWAALEFLRAMPDSPAPVMLGGDWDRQLLVLDGLPAGRSLAASLLGADAAIATADLRSYAIGLARIHAWSAQRLPALVMSRARLGLDDPSCSWARASDETNRAAFVALLRDLGISTTGLARELDDAHELIFNGPYQTMVHGDACPDNVRITGDGVRIFDFEISGTGSMALDASFLWAPFPSCWCFATLPTDATTAADDAYRSTLVDHGVVLADDWATVSAAALAVWLVARSRLMHEVLVEDRDWGTTTMRPRLLEWARAAAASATSMLPRTHDALSSLYDLLCERWPAQPTPLYPAFSNDRPAVEAPSWWSEPT